MMRIRLFVLVLLVSLFTSMLAVGAQEATPEALELSESYRTEGGRVSFSYPAEWELAVRAPSEGEYLDARLSNTRDVLDQSPGAFGAGLESGQVYIELAVGDLSQVTGGLEGVSAESSMVDILEMAFQAADRGGSEFGEITALEIGGRLAGRIDARSEDGGEGFVVLVDYGDGIIGGIAFGTASGELIDWEGTALAIVESIVVKGAEEATPEATEAALLELTESVMSGNGLLTVNYPEGWLTDESGEQGVYIAPDKASLDHSFGDSFASGEVEILVSVDTVENLMAEMNLPLESDAGAQKILQGAVKAVSAEGGITFDPVESFSVGDQPAAVTRFTSVEFEGIAWAVEYPPDYIMVVQLLAAPGEAAQWEALTVAIMDAVQYPG